MINGNSESLIIVAVVAIIIGWMVFSTFTNPAELCEDQYGQN